MQNKDAIGDNALFFHSGDIGALARKLEFAIANQSYLDTIGIRAHHWIIANRNWELLKDEYLKIFSGIGGVE